MLCAAHKRPIDRLKSVFINNLAYSCSAPLFDGRVNVSSNKNNKNAMFVCMSVGNVYTVKIDRFESNKTNFTEESLWIVEHPEEPMTDIVRKTTFSLVSLGDVI